MKEHIKKYDIALLGASPLSILEAVNHSRNGQSVIIFEKEENIGGVWSTINACGYKNVENAIHYLLPSKKGIYFLEKNLNLKIEISKSKYRVFKIPLFGFIKIRYDNILSALLADLINHEINFSFFKKLFKRKKPSYYLKNGSQDLLDKMNQILFDSSVKLEFNLNVSKVVFLDNYIKIFSDDNHIYNVSKIVFTNSSRLRNLYKKGIRIKVKEKIQPRPSVHILVKDSEFKYGNEIIFIRDSIIKYVHDVTRFINIGSKNKKLFIVALKHDLIEKEEVYEKIIVKFIECGICGANARIINKKWTKVILPRLFNDDLDYLKQKLGDRLIILKTENFTEAIEENIIRWNKFK